MSVYEAMSRSPVIVGPQLSLLECAQRMIEEKVGSLLVLENQMLKGIVTEKDMVGAVAKDLDKKKTKVSEIMSKSIIAIKPQKDLLEAIRLMSEKEVRRLPVIDEKNNLVGMLTASDILRVEPELLEIVFDKGVIGKRVSKLEDGECNVCGSFTLVNYNGDKRVCNECK